MSGEPLRGDDRVVITGASLAGSRTAAALRDCGFSGQIVLIGDETHAPYDRPPLSKQYLAGSADRTALTLEPSLDALDVELLLGRRAQALDLARRLVTLDDNSQIGYDRLVIATGAHARSLSQLIDGPTDRVHVLRTVEDSDRLANQIGDRVVVVGAGFIGAEVASTALSSGSNVTIIDPEPWPMSRVLGPLAGERMTTLMRTAGADLRLGVGVRALHVLDGDGCVVVELADGTTVEADTVVTGVGAVPNTDWLVTSGLELDDGVVCDAALFADDSVVAVGDVARWTRVGDHARVRVEHWTTAAQQAGLAARNLVAGRKRAEPFVEQPYVWSDQFGVRIEAIGFPSVRRREELIWSGPPPASSVFAYYDGDDLTAVVGVGAVRQLLTIRRALATGRPFDEHLVSELATPGTAKGTT